MAAGDLLEAVRAGSRWLNAEPTEDQVKEWFEKQPLHAGMTHGPYLGGIVILAQEEEYKETVRNAQDQTFVRESKRAAFTPYVKVDTRVRYFWDYVEELNGELNRDVVGVIEPDVVPRITDPSSAFYNAHLPEGFSVHAVKNQNETIKRFVLATYRVAIYERQSYIDRLNGKAAFPVLQGRGVKQVPTNYRNGWADDASLMKAETGAIGRALGVAGILTVGTGVASAEDMQEALQGAGGATTPGEAAEPALPPVVDREGAPVGAGAAAESPEAEVLTTEQQEQAQERSDDELRAHALNLRARLEEADPEAWKRYVEWYTSRDFPPLEQLSGVALKGAVTKLERDLDAAAGGMA